jgi:hypothetical protein
MPTNVSDLLTMSQTLLDELFTRSDSGAIPNGEARGTAIVAPGTTYTQDIAQFDRFRARISGDKLDLRSLDRRVSLARKWGASGNSSTGRPVALSQPEI